MAERLTWDQIQGANFSGSNEAARMATSLLGSASAPLVDGLDSYQKALAAQQSGQLMQRVNAQQDPATIAAGLASGDIYKGLDPRYLTPEAQTFAAGQAQRLLTEAGTAAETNRTQAQTGLIGVQTQQGQYDFNRQSTVTDPRADAEYAAKQEVQPLLFDIAELGRAGKADEARALIAQNEAKLAAAGLSADGLYAGISTNVAGGQTEEQSTANHETFIREYGDKTDVRAITAAATKAYTTQAQAEAGIRDAIAQGKMKPEVGQAVLAALPGLWQPLTAEQQALSDAGITMPGARRGNSDTSWLPPSAAAARYREAIGGIESAGSGGYSAVGPTDQTLGRALGKYQIMEANIPAWSKEVLGREITADEFLKNPALQDQIFDAKFGQYVAQYGEQGASQAWFSGPGGVGDNSRTDSLGTTNGDYAARFGAALGYGPGVPSVADAGRQPGASEAAAQASALLGAPNRPDLSFGSTDPTAAAARQAVQAATEGASQPAASATPQIKSGDAAAVTAALQAASAQPRTMDPTQQAMLDQNISNAQTAQNQQQTFMNTPPADVPVGTRTSNPRESALDADLVARQAAEDRAKAAATPVDTRSGLRRDLGAIMSNTPFTEVNARVGNITSRLVNGTGDLLAGDGLNAGIGNMVDYAFSDPKTAAENAAGREEAGKALEWYRGGSGGAIFGQTSAEAYFEQHPERLPEAENDPVGFALQRIAEDSAAATGAMTDTSQATGGQVDQQKLATDAAQAAQDLSAPINTAEMQRALDNVQIGGKLDNINNDFSAMDAAMEKLPNTSNSLALATALTGEGAQFTGKDPNTVARLIEAVARDVGVDRKTAVGLIAQVIPTEDSWNWTGMTDGLPDYDVSKMKEIVGLYRQDTTAPDGTVVTGQQAGVNRLRTAREIDRATTKVQQIQTLFDSAKAEMLRQQALDPTNSAEIQKQFEENVFPQFRQQLDAIEATNLMDTYTSGRTTQ